MIKIYYEHLLDVVYLSDFLIQLMLAVVHNNMLSASNLQPLLQRSQGVDEQQQTKRSIQRGYHKSGGYYGPVLDPSARPKGRHGIAADNAKNYEQSYANHRRKSVYWYSLLDSGNRLAKIGKSDLIVRKSTILNGLGIVCHILALIVLPDVITFDMVL